MHDPIFRSFLLSSHDEAMALAASSDLLELEPLAGSPPTRFIAHFTCRGLVFRNNVVAASTGETALYSSGNFHPQDGCNVP